jgi:hypothetical protein
MPRFTLREVLLSITIIAVGLGLLNASVQVNDLARSILALCAFATIGAGLFTPFHKKRLGAVLGLVLPLAFFLIMNLVGIRV